MGVFLSVVGDDLESPGIENLRDSIGEQHKNYEDFGDCKKSCVYKQKIFIDRN